MGGILGESIGEKYFTKRDLLNNFVKKRWTNRGPRSRSTTPLRVGLIVGSLSDFIFSFALFTSCTLPIDFTPLSCPYHLYQRATSGVFALALHAKDPLGHPHHSTDNSAIESRDLDFKSKERSQTQLSRCSDEPPLRQRRVRNERPWLRES